MDGVLVDFDGGYVKIAHSIKTDGMDKVSRISAIRKAYLDAGATFWANLGWEPGGQEVWNTAKRLFERVCILSSTGAKDDPTGRGKIVEEGKYEWIKKNLHDMSDSNVFIVHGKHFKQNYATKTSILVDDMRTTIEQWNKAGGFGILHDSRRYKDTIETLIEIAAPLNLTEIMKLIRH